MAAHLGGRRGSRRATTWPLSALRWRTYERHERAASADVESAAAPGPAQAAPAGHGGARDRVRRAGRLVSGRLRDCGGGRVPAIAPVPVIRVTVQVPTAKNYHPMIEEEVYIVRAI